MRTTYLHRPTPTTCDSLVSKCQYWWVGEVNKFKHVSRDAVMPPDVTSRGRGSLYSEVPYLQVGWAAHQLVPEQ